MSTTIQSIKPKSNNYHPAVGRTYEVVLYNNETGERYLKDITDDELLGRYAFYREFGVDYSALIGEIFDTEIE